MKLLLLITAIFEGMVGIGFFVTPVLAVSILLSTQLESAGGIFAARLCGAAILTLAICCWKARSFETRESAIGVVTAMLFYNLAASAVLVYGGLRLGLQSPFIWPAIVGHAALGVWCSTLLWFSIRNERRSQA
jgi:hypothetical protein